MVLPQYNYILISVGELISSLIGSTLSTCHVSNEKAGTEDSVINRTNVALALAQFTFWLENALVTMRGH